MLSSDRAKPQPFLLAQGPLKELLVLQVLTGKGYTVSRLGRDRLVKTFLQAIVEEVPKEWTYEIFFHDLNKIDCFQRWDKKTAFINYRTTIYTPANFGMCAGWPSPGVLSGRPRGGLALFTGAKVVCLAYDLLSSPM